MKTQEILMLKSEQLITHPRNMRKFYPKDQVQEMADSILAHGGVIEPLIVVRDGGKKYLFKLYRTTRYIESNPTW